MFMRKVNPVETRWVNVTPEIANEFLKKARPEWQRPVREWWAKRLMREHFDDKLDGRVIVIVFCKLPNGEHININGQHTLLAVKNAGKPLETNIQYINVKDEKEARKLYTLYDNQLRRTMTDSYRAMGVSKEIPGRWVRGFTAAVKMLRASFTGHTCAGHTSRRPNDYEVAEDSHEWLDDFFRFMTMVRKADGPVLHYMQSGTSIAVGLLGLKYQKEKAQKFWPVVATGVIQDGITNSNDPRKRLYDHILGSSIKGRMFLTAKKKLFLLGHVWRLFLQGKDLTTRLALHDIFPTYEKVKQYPMKIEGIPDSVFRVQES